jgi:hypothetical protein
MCDIDEAIHGTLQVASQLVRCKEQFAATTYHPNPHANLRCLDVATVSDDASESNFQSNGRITFDYTYSCDDFPERAKLASSGEINSIYSDIFYDTAGHPYDLIVYPNGHVEAPGFISLFLRVNDHEFLPTGWTRTLSFTMECVDQSEKHVIRHDDDRHDAGAQGSHNPIAAVSGMFKTVVGTLLGGSGTTKSVASKGQHVKEAILSASNIDWGFMRK